jgi:hypothetical protein
MKNLGIQGFRDSGIEGLRGQVKSILSDCEN